MLLNVLLILLPWPSAILFPLSSQRLIKLVNQSLGKMVYLILFLMGLGLAYVEPRQQPGSDLQGGRGDAGPPSPPATCWRSGGWTQA